MLHRKIFFIGISSYFCQIPAEILLSFAPLIKAERKKGKEPFLQ